MTLYTFHLVCPVCGVTSEQVRDRATNPRLNCGNCLIENVEIVEMKVIGVSAEQAK